MGTRLDVRAGSHAGVAALEGATLIFAQAAPHAGILTAFESPAQAFVDHRASAADSLGFVDLNECWPGVSNGKEQLRIFVTAGRLVAPVHASSLQKNCAPGLPALVKVFTTGPDWEGGGGSPRLPSEEGDPSATT